MESGPISDLEGQLRPDWWKTLFSATYLKTDGDVVENGPLTSREVDVFVEALGLRPLARILDLCCGQGRHLLELWQRGFRDLAGADSSRFLVRLARKRARLAAASMALHEADATDGPNDPTVFPARPSPGTGRLAFRRRTSRQAWARRRDGGKPCSGCRPPVPEPKV